MANYKYIPAVLVQEYRADEAHFHVKVSDKGATFLTPIDPVYEYIKPCSMGEMVALFNGDKKVLDGPFNGEELPKWAAKFIERINKK